MPRSFRNIVSYGNFILSGLAEGVFLRVGKEGKVEGTYLAIADLPDLPITKILTLANILSKKVEQVNGKGGTQIILTPSDIGAIAASGNLSDLADVIQARASLGLGSAALRGASEFELAGAANSAIISHQQTSNHPLATTSTPGLMSSVGDISRR